MCDRLFSPLSSVCIIIPVEEFPCVYLIAMMVMAAAMVVVVHFLFRGYRILNGMFAVILSLNQVRRSPSDLLEWKTETMQIMPISRRRLVEAVPAMPPSQRPGPAGPPAAGHRKSMIYEKQALPSLLRCPAGSCLSGQRRARPVELTVPVPCLRRGGWEREKKKKNERLVKQAVFGIEEFMLYGVYVDVSGNFLSGTICLI